MPPNNPLSVWGNEKTMNLNPLILTNIQSSPYFKVNLYELKTYHEVIDEIYYKVDHLEPWEKGSRKTAGQTGMCGGVRGVGAGGIVSSAFCLLYKLFTLKLTKKQVIGLCTHADSPYIRGLGFMYIRYTQEPKELWDWYEQYLDDEEEIDVKAGGGHKMMIGEMLRQWLAKLEWYSTLFPRVPVPVQKDIDMKLRAKGPMTIVEEEVPPPPPVQAPENDGSVNFGEAERFARMNRRSPASEPVTHSPRRSPHRRSPRRSPVGRSPSRRSPRRSPPRPSTRRSPQRRSPTHRAVQRSLSPKSGFDFARELEKEKERQQREKSKDTSLDGEKKRHKSRSRSRDRKRHRSRSKERAKKTHKRSKDKDFARGSDYDRHSKSRDGHKIKSHHRADRERDHRRSAEKNGDV